MPEILNEPWLAAGLAALLALLAAGILAWIRRHRRTARCRRLGRQGEERALTLLREAGYRLLDTQCCREATLLIDGQVERFQVRADGLAERRRRRYVVEIKGGAEASRITNRQTRRQLREYAAVYRADGVLLVDAHRGEVHEVAFPD